MATKAMMSQSEYADYRGVTRGSVSKWKSRQLLVFVEGPGGHLMIDVARTDARVNANVDPTRGRASKSRQANADHDVQPVQPAPIAPPDDPRLDLVREKRTTEALRNAQLAGTLVPLAEFTRRATEIGRITQERVRGALRNEAERLSTIGDTRSMMLALDDIVHDVFVALADDVAQGLLDTADDSDSAQVDADAQADLMADLETHDV